MSYLIRGQEIEPSTEAAYGQRVKVIATEAIAKYDIVTVTGNSGRILKVSKADADGAASVRVGPMFVALGKATAADDVIEVAPWAIVDSVNTSAASAAGDLVYLGFALPGGNVITKPSGPDDAIIPVGRVLTVHASTGVMLLCPQDATLRSSMIRAGTASLPNANPASISVALGAAFANGRVVCQYAKEGALAATPGELKGFIAADGTLTMTTKGNTGEVIPVSYIAYAASLTN
jgi:hypothetical protein